MLFKKKKIQELHIFGYRSERSCCDASYASGVLSRRLEQMHKHKNFDSIIVFN